MTAAVESNNSYKSGRPQAMQNMMQRPSNVSPPLTNLNDSPNSPTRNGGVLSAYEQYSMDSGVNGDPTYRSGMGNGKGTIANHYEVPNLSSMLYEYTNKERDRVFASFRVGNYNSLRELPRHLIPGNISLMHKSKI